MNNNLYEVSFSNAKIGCNNIVFSILRLLTLPLIFVLIITFGLAFYANNILSFKSLGGDVELDVSIFFI